MPPANRPDRFPNRGYMNALPDAPRPGKPDIPEFQEDSGDYQKDESDCKECYPHCSNPRRVRIRIVKSKCKGETNQRRKNPEEIDHRQFDSIYKEGAPCIENRGGICRPVDPGEIPEEKERKQQCGKNQCNDLG